MDPALPARRCEDTVLDLLLAAGLGASLVAMSTIAAARWGHVIGGVLSAFPLIVGPVLLVAARRHGTAFAAHTAAATRSPSRSIVGPRSASSRTAGGLAHDAEGL
jgi:hypothetical protein